MLKPLKLQVRFSDCDMMQHVNNAVYLNYFEEARIHYFKQLLSEDWNWNTHGIILRKNEIEYLKPVFLYELVEVHMYRKHIGTKSFVLSYDVIVGGEVRCVGDSVLVCYNNFEKKSTEMYSELALALSQIPEK